MIIRLSKSSKSAKPSQVRYTCSEIMATLKLIEEIIATYRRHEWQLRRVLLSPMTRKSIAENIFGDAIIQDSEIDALWFSRPSHKGAEAWELRLIAEQQYALFEAFEPDESEDQRDEVRQEMEARMREHTAS